MLSDTVAVPLVWWTGERSRALRMASAKPSDGDATWSAAAALSSAARSNEGGLALAGAGVVVARTSAAVKVGLKSGQEDAVYGLRASGRMVDLGQLVLARFPGARPSTACKPPF